MQIIFVVRGNFFKTLIANWLKVFQENPILNVIFSGTVYSQQISGAFHNP